MALPDFGPTGAVPPRKEIGPSATLRDAFGAKPPSGEIFGGTATVLPPQDPHVISVTNENVAVGIGAAARKDADSPPTLPTDTLQPPLSPGGAHDSRPVSDVATREPQTVKAGTGAQVFSADEAVDTIHPETEQQPELLQHLNIRDDEGYQIFRPGRSELPGEKYDEMIERIRELDADEREVLAADPFSESSRTKLNELFPDISPLDQARAVILVQPPTAYDKAFAELSPDEQKEELHRYIDRTADMVVRYDAFVDENDDSLWEMPPEEIYQQAIDAVLPPEDTLSGYQLRGLRLMAVNLIGDLETFRPYRQRQDTEPETVTSEILSMPVFGDPIVDVRPYGIMITLDPEDFELANYKFHDGHAKNAHGLTLHGHDLPPALGRKVGIITNQGRKKSLKTVRKDDIYTHEYTHIKTDTLRMPDASKRRDLAEKFDDITHGGLPYTEELTQHRKLAATFGGAYLPGSQSEIIAYTAQGYFDITPDNLTIGPINKTLSAIETILMKRPDLTTEQKTEIYEAYENSYIHYLNDVRTYFWIASSLSSAAGSKRSPGAYIASPGIASEGIDGALKQPYQSSLAQTKVVALLQLAENQEFMKGLGIYLGIDPDKLPQAFEASQTHLVQNYVFLNRYYKNDRQSFAREVAQTFPEEALPELCNKLREPNRNPQDIAITVNTVGHILAINHKKMSPEDLMWVEISLYNATFNMAPDPAYNQAKKMADELIAKTNRYIQGTQFQFEVAEFWDRDKPPTVAQAAQYVSLVTGKNDSILWHSVDKDILGIIPILGKDSQGVPALIAICRSSYYPDYITAAINTLRDNKENIPPEQRPEVEIMLSTILTDLQQKGDGETDEVDVDLKNAAQSLLDGLKHA